MTMPAFLLCRRVGMAVNVSDSLASKMSVLRYPIQESTALEALCVLAHNIGGHRLVCAWLHWARFQKTAHLLSTLVGCCSRSWTSNPCERQGSINIPCESWAPVPQACALSSPAAFDPPPRRQGKRARGPACVVQQCRGEWVVVACTYHGRAVCHCAAAATPCSI